MARFGYFGHILFWLVYLTWQAYTEYLFNFSGATSFSFSEKIWAAITVEACLLPVKIALCYSCACVIGKSLAREQSTWLKILLITGLVLISIVIHRWVSNYVAYPLALHEPVDIPFWGPSYLTNSVIDMITIFGLFNFINFFELRSILVRDREIARQEKLEAELHFLRSQINPHFLFNTLNNIYVLAKNHQDKAPEAIHKLAGLLRFILYESNQELIPLDQEMDFIRDYLELEKLRYKPGKLNLEVELPGNSSQSIAPMLILPVVENAFKHGISESQHDSFINLHISLAENVLKVHVENSYEPSDATHNPGIGLTNLKKRLELLYRDYHMNQKDQNHVYTVDIEINLNSYATTKLPHHRR